MADDIKICNPLSGIKYDYCAALVSQCIKDETPIVIDTFDGKKEEFRNQSSCKNFALFRAKLGAPGNFVGKTAPKDGVPNEETKNNTSSKDVPKKEALQQEVPKASVVQDVIVNNCRAEDFGGMDEERPAWVDSDMDEHPEHYYECYDEDDVEMGSSFYFKFSKHFAQVNVMQHYCAEQVKTTVSGSESDSNRKTESKWELSDVHIFPGNTREYVEEKDDQVCFHVFFEWSQISCLSIKKTFTCE